MEGAVSCVVGAPPEEVEPACVWVVALAFVVAPALLAAPCDAERRVRTVRMSACNTCLILSRSGVLESA
jgi:hypothetical protein